MIVVDTNVICYFYLPGANSGFAQRAYNKDPAWMVPHLWRSEMRNVLMRYVRQGQMLLTDAIDIMNRAEALLLTREYEVSSAQVLQLSDVSGCTAYDCEFVALAQNFKISLVTMDKQVLAAFPHLALSLNRFATT